MKSKHNNLKTGDGKAQRSGENMDTISEEEEEDDESMGWSSESSEESEREEDLDICEFGGLNENSKIIFELVGEGSLREGVIVTKDTMDRRLRILEKGETDKGAWYSYDIDFKSLDIVF